MSDARIGAAAAPAGAERRSIARHAGTVLLGQLAVMAFSVIDTVVAGRYAEDALAALSVASAIFVSVYVALMGVLQALLPIWAELHGARRPEDIGRSVRQSLYLCAVATAIGMAILLYPDALLRWTGVPDAMRAEVRRYLNVLAFALPPTLLFRLFATLCQGLGRPQLVTRLQVLALPVKLVLSIWFAFGGAGLPALGLVGCGWASLLVNWALLAGAAWLLRTERGFASCGIWRRMEPPDWRQIGQFLRLGLPAGLSMLVEITSFTLMALFISRLGTAAAAAHQIAANLTALCYMVPLSLAIATSARVSWWLGAGSPAQARQACLTGLRMALAAAMAMALGMFLLRWQLPAVYSDNPQVLAMAAMLLAATAVFHLADATQALCVFVLRSYRVTLAPLAIYCALLWGVGLAGGYLLAYQGLGPWAPMRSPLAFWVMGALALAVAAALVALLLRRAVRRSLRAA
ncbi:MATE family efflux transporter [Variovorax sp.]|uniref:MATE family efflux transporter n=1 Tax=Variovorax sp. TaxID=1871043 RepID=UPI002D26F4C1|nr:MATE family efflux transporter [Variovorax sp.]HYP85761.1 MATE family efflux transporter [Variovorax sp.]